MSKTDGVTSKNETQGSSAPTTPDKNDDRLEEQKLTPTRSTRSATRAKSGVSTPDRPSDASPIKSKTKEIKTEIQEVEEKNGDLIAFYNLVFVKEIKDFALKFAQKGSVFIYHFFKSCFFF